MKLIMVLERFDEDREYGSSFRSHGWMWSKIHSLRTHLVYKLQRKVPNSYPRTHLSLIRARTPKPQGVKARMKYSK